jgi:[ribosomal protein S18]-alanine N-acetyltransferase
MQNYKIHSLNCAYLDQAYQIDQQLNGNHSWSRQMFLGELNNALAYYWVLTEEETVIGFIGLHDLDPEGYITNFGIKAEYQGQKLGQYLLSFVIHKCLHWNLKALSLEVNENNLRAINLYKKFGFKEEGFRKDYYRNSETGRLENALVMWLNPVIKTESLMPICT